MDAGSTNTGSAAPGTFTPGATGAKRVLILGGNGWLGRHLAEFALASGHHVTCLARGVSGQMPIGTEVVIADRDADAALDQVGSRSWDLVIDVSRQPGQVRRAVRSLAPRTDMYAFVSSGSVYADTSRPGASEDAPVLAPLAADVMPGMEFYGEAKVACEQAVLAAFGPDRSLIARAGLIGGPGDETTRSGYWPLRFARPSNPAGQVLVPDTPDLMIQLIDVRDLAAWLVRAGCDRRPGTFNAVGEPMPLPEHLQVAQRTAGFTGSVIPVPPGWLAERQVAFWMGPRSLPLWLPLPDYAGFGARDGSRARAAGLSTRPLAVTLRDTLEWELTRPPGTSRGAGLTDAEERDLLAVVATVDGQNT